MDDIEVTFQTGNGKGKRKADEMESEPKNPTDSSSEADDSLNDSPSKPAKSMKTETQSNTSLNSSNEQEEEKESDDQTSPSKEVAGTSSAEKADHDAALNKRKKQEAERTKMQLLVSNFSEDQLNRYEMFRRAAFPKASVRRLMQCITGSTVAQNVVIAMSGISKVYVGEIVETALDVIKEWGESGPIQPKHLREAVRRMKTKDAVPNSKYKKKLLR